MLYVGLLSLINGAGFDPPQLLRLQSSSVLLEFVQRHQAGKGVRMQAPETLSPISDHGINASSHVGLND